jgi:hypothetical protein
MKLALTIAASVLALAACQPADTTSADAALAAGCAVRAEAPWGPIGASDHPSYRIEAYTNGSICEVAVITMVIRARDGYPAYVWAGEAEQLMGLGDQPDTAAMTKALGEWIDPTASNIQTTGDLPPWDETEGQAKRAEFPFMPAEWLDQETYEAIRTEKAPVYCFVQGMESLNCVALRDGQIEDLGLQLFPG